MHILLLSDYESQSGGAAISASRLAEAFIDNGQQTTRLVSYPDGKKHRWETISLSPSFLAWMGLRKLPRSFAKPFANREAVRKLALLLKILKPDVINIHNVHGALSNGWSAELLLICQEFAPVIWTLHDMWSFTGRCAFSFECEKYLTGCDETCPTPHEYPCLPSREISKAWQDRVNFFQKSSRLAAVTPSAWLAAKAREGLWQGLRVERIPNSLPLDVYAPVEKTVARQALGLDVRSPVLLMAGVNLAERRKGIGIAIEAITKTRQRPLTLLTLGSDPPPINLPDVWVQHLGFIDHERTKALVFNAADLFIHPALADNLPNTVIESIACGTPVIAFGVGGLPELVHPGKTGWLAPGSDAESFAQAIDIALKEIVSGAGLRDTCRQVAKDEFSSELQGRRYLELIRQIG